MRLSKPAPSRKSPPLLPKKRASSKQAGAAPKAVPAEKEVPAGPPGLEQSYERLRQLGRGSYGIVWLVRRKADQQLLAMKSVPLPPLASRDEKAMIERRQALREVESLQQLRSQHVVRYADMLLSPPTAEIRQSELHIFTEYCEAGDLEQYLQMKGKGRGLSEAEVWSFAVPVLAGLRDLHECRILHRDLKPANIFLRRVSSPSPSGPKSQKEAGILKPLLGDLGLARTVSESQPLASTLVGTPHYCAPEIFEGVQYCEKADIYSFGVCVYELMHGRTPHSDVKNIVGLVRRVLRLDLGGSCKLAGTVSMDARFTLELRGLVSACLEQRPEARPTAAELLQRVPDKHRLGNKRPAVEALAADAFPGELCSKQSSSGGGGSTSSFSFRPLTRRSNSDVEASKEKGEAGDPAKQSGQGSKVEEAERTQRLDEASRTLESTLLPPRDSPDIGAGSLPDDMEKEEANQRTVDEVELDFSVEDEHGQAAPDAEITMEAPVADAKVAEVLRSALLLAEHEPQPQQGPAAEGSLRDSPASDATQLRRPENEKACEESRAEKESSEGGNSVPDERSPAGADDAGGPSTPARKSPDSPARKPPPSPARPAPQFPAWKLSVAPPAAAGADLSKVPSTSLAAAESSVETNPDGHCGRFVREQKRPVWGQAVKPKSGPGDLLSYVSRAQECWSRWRRERLDAKAALQKPAAKRTADGPSAEGKVPGLKARSAKGLSAGCKSGFSDSACSIEGLEIRGVAPPMTPKPSRQACRV